MEGKDVILDVRGLKQYFYSSKGWFEGEHCVRAVDGVDLQVKTGETLGIVGESGSGKSTLLRSIAQLKKNTAGEVIFEGQDISKMSEKEFLPLRRHMQMIFQDPYASLDPRMNVRQIISEPLIIYKKRGLLDLSADDIEARVRDLMRKVGLLEEYINRYPHEFSGGQRQRIGIARALALNPKMILADEPVSALDVSVQSQILNLLKDLQRELNLTYLFIAHDLAVVRYMSTRIAVMYLGRVVELADADVLYNKPYHPYTKALLSAIPIPDPQQERAVQRIILKGEITSSAQESGGCPFADRCPSVRSQCREEVPTLVEIEPDHYAACIFAKNLL